MPNFLAELTDMIGEEKVLGVRFLSNREGYADENTPYLGQLVTWDLASLALDYEYDNNCYGGQDCHSLYIWTPTRVITIWEYDGATWTYAIPRDPF